MSHDMDERRKPIREILNGIGLVLLLNVLAAVLLAGLAPEAVALVLIASGFYQIVYVIPLYVAVRVYGRPGVARGIAIGASLCLLLNGTLIGYGLYTCGNMYH